MIDEQPKGGSADHQRQQSRRYLNPDDVLLLRLESAKSVHGLQLTEQQFYEPPSTLECRDVYGTERLAWQDCDIQPIPVIGVLVEDADDSESFTVPRSRLVVHSPLERHFDLHVEVPSTQITKDGEHVLPFKRNGATAPFPQFPDDQWVRTPLEFADEEAAVFVDSRKPVILEKPEIQQK